MIELITGTPGAGKTTYAVATRLAAEAKREIALDPETCIKLGADPGTKVRRRLVVAGVRGLVLDHERLPHILTRDATPVSEVEAWNAMQSEVDQGTGKAVQSEVPRHQRLPGDPPLAVPAIMQNWWLWCMPGDLIVIDEAQFVMPRGTLGKRPPYWLQAMEIHRHYGVDFLLITQHPQLIDTTVRALVGMHRHIRAVMGSSVCMVYAWDHASNPERYNMASKGTFVRRREHFKLFHSAAAHVKPPSAGRWGIVAAPVLALVGFGGLAWKVQAFGGDGGQAPASVAASASAVVGAPRPGAQGASVTGRRDPAFPRGFVDVPKLSGCYSYAKGCQCIDEAGRPVRIERAACEQSAASFEGLVRWEPRKPVPETASPPAAGNASQGAASAPSRGLLGSVIGDGS